MSKITRFLPPAAVLAALALSGCSHSPAWVEKTTSHIPWIGKKSSETPRPAKENSKIATETEKEFRTRWVTKRTQDLASQGMPPDAAKAQADAEFDDKFIATHVSKSAGRTRPEPETVGSSMPEQSSYQPAVASSYAPAAPAPGYAAAPSPAPAPHGAGDASTLKSMIKRWNALPAESKTRMRDFLQKWNSLPDEDKVMFPEWTSLSDEDRQLFRQLIG